MVLCGIGPNVYCRVTMQSLPGSFSCQEGVNKCHDGRGFSGVDVWSVEISCLH